MQTQGSLQESDLASLLQTMQSERATGTLTLEDGSETCALYFLFGHLFHAAGPEGEGEDVVTSALGWRAGTFHFDPRAKLPAEETIKSSPAELIAAAEIAAQEPAGAGSSTWHAPSLRAIDGEGAGAEEPREDPARAEPAAWAPAAAVSERSAAQQAQPWTPGRAESAAAYAPADYSPTYVPAEPAPVRPVARPATADAARPMAGAATVSPTGALPIPAGRPQYEGLKSAFVDFPRLLRTLRGDRHTGYVRLVSGAWSGVLLFRDGELIEAEGGDGDAVRGDAAFSAFRRQMDTGEGLIDVVDLDSDTVAAVGRMLTGPPLFTGLLARFVNFHALLEYLGEERLDGSVIVLGPEQTGVILLSQGSVLAAYTSDQATPHASTEAVDSLASQRPARIEVRGEDTGRGHIDIEAALSRPR